MRLRRAKFQLCRIGGVAAAKRRAKSRTRASSIRCVRHDPHGLAICKQGWPRGAWTGAFQHGMPQSAKGCGFARGLGWRFRRSGHDTRVPACRFFPAARRKRARAFALNRLEYRSALDDERDLPAWVDEALRKVLLISPAKRYGKLSEFVADLRRPNREFMNRRR